MSHVNHAKTADFLTLKFLEIVSFPSLVTLVTITKSKLDMQRGSRVATCPIDCVIETQLPP
jgi:hypothetical protein